jgi:DNA-binding PadR family transcriptional regulator
MIIYQHEDFISVEDILKTIQLNLPGNEPSTGAIYKTLNALHKRCLIKKRVKATDKRIKHYIITDKGRFILQKLYFEHLRFMKFMQKYCASCSAESQKKPEKK